jgi:hypothetical protein
MKRSLGKVRICVIAALGAVASAILTFAVLTASRAQLATSPWPMLGHDPLIAAGVSVALPPTLQ